MTEKTLHFQSSRHLSQLYVGDEANLAKVEKELGVDLVTRDDWVKIRGSEHGVEKAEVFFDLLDKGRSQGLDIRVADFENFLRSVGAERDGDLEDMFAAATIIQLRNRSIVPKTVSQKRYIKFMRKYEVVFGIGAAGTGKTYLAIAAALDALMNKQVERLVLTRPAVEAGEALGFLPGDLTEKILPYLRPLYDAMYDMVGQEYTQKLLEKGVIEIAPLAYMRGRTLSDAFIILDEAQNTTAQQMMMFLTRLGDRARMVVTGDITQVDLPRAKASGLKQAIEVLGRVEGIKFFYFKDSDVVRHPLVMRIIEAYQHYHNETGADSR